MTLERAFWIFWLGGLVLFALLAIPHGPLAIPEVPGGIFDHQVAGTAAEAGRIQRAWASAGVYENARWGMISDLAFIGVYGIGALLGGLLFRRERDALGKLGLIIAFAAVVFLVTDYTETIAQLIQLLRGEGDDRLAGLAATVQPVKTVAWIVSAVGLFVAIFLRRRKRSGA